MTPDTREPIQGRISVVIPNWNGLRFLDECLSTLAAQTHPDVETIVVDNASADGSATHVRGHYPGVRVVELASNRGFTGACNAGIGAATGAIVALLNNDTAVDPGWAAAVQRAFDGHPEIGIVASRMMLYSDRDRFHTAGDLFTVDGQALNRGVWELDRGQYDQPEEVFSACGGSSAYRRALLDEVGVLDDDFFFLLEDMDLAWRAQLLGWRALYTPDAIVYHHLSATGGGKTASYYDGRNSIWLLVKNYPAALWRKYWRAILRRQLADAADALRAWRGEAARARLRGMVAALPDLPLMLAKRRTIQASRRVSIAEIESRLHHPTRPSPPPEHPA
jgi:GT2 family glycosyltransferase